jgi:peptidoglycan hydrolase-like protein with peptidoglycan-binding domain
MCDRLQTRRTSYAIHDLDEGGVAASILLARLRGHARPTGNQTSYATGSYRMPAKTQAAQPPMQARANGDATAADSRTRSNAPVNATQVQAAQHALERAGYHPGNATGSIDPPTRDALVQFQRANGLRATGDLDSSTMSALGLPTQ